MGMPPFVNVFSWIVIVFLCIWIGIALFGTINPYYFWKVTQSWRALNEPPKMYFIMSRIWSGIFALIGLALLLAPLFR